MASKLTRINQAWNEYSTLLTRKETSLQGINIDDLLSSFFCPGPFYYYIFDFSNLSMVYVHPKMKEIFNVDREKILLDDIIELYHPDDITHVTNCEQAALEFIIGNMPPEKRKKYKMSYSFRMKVASGSYRLFLQQAVAITLDEKGNLGKVIGVHTDISHITTTNDHKISFLGLDGEPSFTNIDPLELIDGVAPLPSPFSKREVEIIQLLAEGFTAKEISQNLLISNETVRTHQRNILSKSECKNTVELVGKCIREGLI